ncbi:phage major capsid protein [Jiella avicenniae]|uniref:Phage major capsid protein n=1 Tax=Jiella avicenniae TaxID=2907202 RepID=A0A9X1P1X2_9HYPH|nr:phage major capsid protein [Jiella avicenniae]MCE7029537.1 phage major capsid protein [Jiella avicenniae]
MELTPQAFSNAIELKSAEDGGDEDANAIVTKALGDLSQTVTDRLAAVERKSAERLDKLEARLNRPGAPFLSAANDTDAEIEKKAVRDYYRTGSDFELKTLSTTVGAASIMAPPQLSTSILEKITLSSPVRQLATTMALASGSVRLPRLVNKVTPGAVAELTPDPRPESEPSFDDIEIVAHEMAHFIPVSRQALEDANVDLSGYLSNHLVREFANEESRWFVNGNGTSEAEGVMTSAAVGVFTAATATLTLDALIDLFHAIKSPYRANGAWLMNGQTIATLHKIKDGDGRPLWQPSIQPGLPPVLFGRPVYEAPDMPNIAAGSTPIIFGDFAAGYTIVDRIGFQPQREDLATQPRLKIGGRRRVGGAVTMGEALVKMKMKTA